MSQLGIGAMIHALGGGSKESAQKYIGKTIVYSEVTADNVILKFSDGVQIQIVDNGQSCCEHRYITCDDNPLELVGQILKDIVVKDYGDSSKEDDWGSHETCFVEIQTDKGSITFCTHNEHNGYYGGFGLSIEEIE